MKRRSATPYDRVRRTKIEKQNHAQENKEKKLVHKEAWENLYESLSYFWDLYNGNVRKEMLIFFRILFE